jgi:alkanesulfonate monooxygenase SsuD/methylene tetrahydromethanopterin reductase-like flavin-dependent oxidoreductase (luciferase family)
MARFSLFICPFSLTPDTDTEVIDTTIDDIAMANDLGFEGVFLSEHHFTGYNVYSSPFVFGARLAPVLTRAWLGFAVATPALYHPARFAEEANLLDQLMKGRLLVGTGAGGIPAETAGFGIHHSEGRARQEAAMSTVFDLWLRQPGDPPYVFDNGYHSGRVLERIVPSSYRRPHPLILRATQTERGVAEAAAKAWPMYVGTPGALTETYETRLRAAGHDDDAIALALRWTSIPSVMYVADSDERALSDLGPAFARMGGWIRAQEDMVDKFWPERPEPDRRRFEPPALGAAPGGGRGPFGDPDTVAAVLRDQMDLGGHDHLMVGYNFGQLDPPLARRSLELFAREVMPQLADRTPDRERGAALRATTPLPTVGV